MAAPGPTNNTITKPRVGSPGSGLDDTTRRSLESDAIELEADPFLPGARDDNELLYDGYIDDSGGAAAQSHHSSSSSPGRKKPRVIWLTLFFVTYSLAFGIALVPRINLVVSLICRQTPLLDPDAPPVVVGGFNPQCQVDAVSAHTAMVQSAGNVVSGVLSMGMSAWLSALSDRVGRVKIVAYAAVVLMCVEVVLVALARAPEGTSYRWLFVAYTLDGLR